MWEVLIKLSETKFRTQNFIYTLMTIKSNTISTQNRPGGKYTKMFIVDISGWGHR